MRRGILFLLCAMLFAGLIPGGNPAHARSLDLQAHMCVGGAESASEALDLASDRLDCGDGRFAERDRIVRTHAELPADFEQGEDELLWQTDPANFERMILRFTYAGGEQRTIELGPEAAGRNWFAMGRFSVRVPTIGQPLREVDMVVEQPKTYSVARAARLVESGAAQQEHFTRSLVYALMCGFLILPIVYDLLLARFLPFRFMLWHAVMTAFLLGSVVSNSGLVFQLFPDLPLGVRSHLNTTTLAIALVAAVGFLLDILEKGTVPTRLAKAAIGLTGVMILAKILTFVEIESLRIVSHELFLYSLVPLTAALIAIIAVALARKSRAAGFLAIAFSGLIITGFLRILIGSGLYRPSFLLDDFLLAAMVVLVLGSAAAVGDRFTVLRVERDRARVSAIKLGRMAMSDPLTGLGNRRAFNSLRHIEDGQAMLVADIDHFKAINDTNGHVMGDAVLCHMSSLMRDSFGDVPDSTIYRLGGEEFAVVFSCNDEDKLRQMGEKLRDSIHRKMASNSYGIPPATISVGGALGGGRSVTEVFQEADQALYSAKQAGRNRCAVKCNGSSPILVDFVPRGVGT